MENLDKRLVVFTGAGISQESGIPTFDEMPEVRNKLTREFAERFPREYAEVIRFLMGAIADKQPNAAHYAIASLDIPVLTMNVDNLHQKAGSKRVINMHGDLPDDVVLYGDLAPRYADAKRIVKNMKYNDSILLVVGTSFHTQISNEIVSIARRNNSKVIIINDNAATRVPDVIEGLKRTWGIR